MIPLATTTVAVLRATADSTRDDMDAPADTARATVATGVRATISSPSGSSSSANGTREEVSFRLGCDPIPAGLSYLDHVRDEQTGDVYFVVWARPRLGLGLDHIEAGLRQVVGEN
jgi:hypothetical protein